MRRLFSLTCGLGLTGALTLTAIAQQPTTCPPGMPAAPWPGPLFVPTQDCQGWVPKNHPAASPAPPTAPPTGDVPRVAAQAIYSALELPAVVSASGGGLAFISGWSVDCVAGSMPPISDVVERKPDGSTRTLPNDYFYAIASRPDVQGGVGPSCPAVYNVPLSDGSGGGPNTLFGWSYRLRSPITEVGVHTFTVMATWVYQGQPHSGSSSVTVTIVP